MKAHSFERFYYERVALSESCGCAEQVINIRDLETFAGESDQGTSIAGALAGLTRFFRRRQRVESVGDRAPG